VALSRRLYPAFEERHNMNPKQLRQGDVLLQPVASLPPGCTEIPNDKGRIVLAYGEVTGHAHAIADHVAYAERRGAAAEEIASAAIARAQTKARLWKAQNGERYLEVTEMVNLTHEEHTAHALLPGIYHLPTQVEYTPAALRRVAD
jgi:hypothetical protein